jgi:hypothetical protein
LRRKVNIATGVMAGGVGLRGFLTRMTFALVPKLRFGTSFLEALLRTASHVRGLQTFSTRKPPRRTAGELRRRVALEQGGEEAELRGEEVPKQELGHEASSHLDEPDRHFSLSAEDFELLNSNTRTCPTFRTGRDARINVALYRRAGVLWREGDPDGNPWGLRFMAMFHMANDSGLFRTRGELAQAGWKQEGNRFSREGQLMLPLYEAKRIHQFDHRFVAPGKAWKERKRAKGQANQKLLIATPPGESPEPARIGHPPEPSVAWCGSDPACEADTGGVQAV